jgi:hypothetical protein
MDLIDVDCDQDNQILKATIFNARSTRPLQRRFGLVWILWSKETDVGRSLGSGQGLTACRIMPSRGRLSNGDIGRGTWKQLEVIGSMEGVFFAGLGLG